MLFLDLVCFLFPPFAWYRAICHSQMYISNICKLNYYRFVQCDKPQPYSSKSQYIGAMHTKCKELWSQGQLTWQHSWARICVIHLQAPIAMVGKYFEFGSQNSKISAGSPFSLSVSHLICMEFSFYWSLEITDVQDLSVTYSMEVRFFVPTNRFTMMMQFFGWPIMLRIIY